MKDLKATGKYHAVDFAPASLVLRKFQCKISAISKIEGEGRSE